MRSHNKERPFACPHHGCGKTFPRKDHLQRHLRNSHAEPERNFVCDWEGCDKTFTSNGRLERHKDVHESKYYCTGYPPCNEAFRKEKTLEAHIKSQHMQAKPYPCTFVDSETGERCTNGYQTEGALRRHMVNAHLEDKEDEHFCMVCIPPETGVETIVNQAGETVTVPKEPLSFASYDELKAHLREVHPPACSQCGTKFKNQQGLKSHIETVHADPATQPKFPCPRPGCGSVFNRKHNLNVHIQAVHDKQFKFICASGAMNSSKHPDLQCWNGENACGAAFKAKSSLEQHIRTHHLGLQNRKATRKQRKKNPQPSTLTLLTGIGYEKGREVPCLFKDCKYRFYMDRDLRRHLRAAHEMSEEAVEGMITERDALTGGQFWIGGLDEPMSMFDSTEPSVPQTPYYIDQPMGMLDGVEAYAKGNEAQHGFFDPQLGDLPMFDAEEAEMDAAMGLDTLAPAVDAQEGLHWDMLAPIEQFDFEKMQG